MTFDQGIDTIVTMLRNPRAYVKWCVLCGGDPALGALFSPNPAFAKRLGEPKGKTRVIIYGLCNSCSELPDRNERVEAQMLQDLGVQ